MKGLNLFDAKSMFGIPRPPSAPKPEDKDNKAQIEAAKKAKKEREEKIRGS